VTKRVEPVRTCVGCRSRVAKSDLLRIVVAEQSAVVDGSAARLVPDLRGQLPGRGAHLHPDLDCLASAERRRVFGRALRLDRPPDATAVVAYVEQRVDS
jgi:predicted RNA-binding protein YlxR (DUF448 family)